MITKSQTATFNSPVVAAQKTKPTAKKKAMKAQLPLKPPKPPSAAAEKSPDGNSISIKNYSVKLGNRLSAAAFSQRVREIVLPELSSKNEERRNGSILKLVLNASPNDPFGDKDFSAILKGPITVTILDSTAKPLGAKTFNVSAVLRANTKLEGVRLPVFGDGQALLHTFTVTVHPLSDLKVA